MRIRTYVRTNMHTLIIDYFYVLWFLNADLQNIIMTQSSFIIVYWEDPMNFVCAYVRIMWLCGSSNNQPLFPSSFSGILSSVIFR